MFKTKATTGLVILLTGIFAVVSCTDNPSSVKKNDTPPTIPSQRSMQMDYSTFNQNNKAKASDKESTGSFIQAVTRVAIFKVIADVNLAIPRVLLQAADTSDAELKDGKWVWNYSKNAGDNDYGVRLTAERTDDNKVDWEFYVTNSKEGVQDQIFFTGASNEDGTEGTWTYYSLKNQKKVSKITWSLNGEDDVNLKLEILAGNKNHSGDSIEYSFNGTLKIAVYYNAGKDETTKIRWNVETHAGFIITPGYNNGEKACWNENFQDVSCSELQ